MNKAESKIARDAINANIVEAERRLSDMIINRDAFQAIIDAPDVYEPVVDLKEAWVVHSDGKVALVNHVGVYFKEDIKQGSIWPTQRLGKIASLREKITNYLGHIQYELCPDFVPDFSDKDEMKYWALIDFRRNKSTYSHGAAGIEANGIFFQTSDQAIEAGNRVKHLVDELNDLIGGK